MELLGRGVHPDRSRWVWTSLLRQPEFVTGEVFRWAVAQAACKKPELDYARVRLEPYGEGLCVQMLHMALTAGNRKPLIRWQPFWKGRGWSMTMGAAIMRFICPIPGGALRNG